MSTPTVGDQFDVSPSDPPLVAGLAAQGPLLGLVEGDLAAHLAHLTALVEGGVGLNAQCVWVRQQGLPGGGPVTAPDVGNTRPSP